tara:strand:+ start:462 stop:1028 length:567 start_codon:yes stop_codon:yes gene_type:complete
MNEYTCTVKLIFDGNNHTAKNIKEYKQKVIEQFNEQFPEINVTEDEIFDVEIEKDFKFLKDIYGYVLPEGLKVFHEIFFKDIGTFDLLYSIRQFGWEDVSYKNDTCPSLALTNKEGVEIYKLWIDHPDPRQREVDTGFRYNIHRTLTEDMWEDLPFFKSNDPVETLNYCKCMVVKVKDQGMRDIKKGV